MLSLFKALKSILRINMAKSIQIEDFSDAITSVVGKGGRISGLSKYVGKKCLVIIEEDEKKGKRRNED